MSKLKSLLRLAESRVLGTLGLRLVRRSCLPQFSSAAILNRFLCANREKLIIFDVGANVGQTALAFAKSFPNSWIYSFEPFAENFTALKRTVKKFSQILPVQAALAQEKKVVSVFRDTVLFSQWNSLHPEAQKELVESSAVTEEEIQTVCGADFCKAEGIDHIDILKTDTEGYDLDVLKGFAGMLEAGEVDIVISEVGFHDKPNHTELLALASYLKTMGFCCRGIFEVAYRPDGLCEYANALFARADITTQK